MRWLDFMNLSSAAPAISSVRSILIKTIPLYLFFFHRLDITICIKIQTCLFCWHKKAIFFFSAANRLVCKWTIIFWMKTIHWNNLNPCIHALICIKLILYCQTVCSIYKCQTFCDTHTLCHIFPRRQSVIKKAVQKTKTRCIIWWCNIRLWIQTISIAAHMKNLFYSAHHGKTLCWCHKRCREQIVVMTRIWTNHCLAAVAAKTIDQKKTMFFSTLQCFPIWSSQIKVHNFTSFFIFSRIASTKVYHKLFIMTMDTDWRKNYIFAH